MHSVGGYYDSAQPVGRGPFMSNLGGVNPGLSRTFCPFAESLAMRNGHGLSGIGEIAPFALRLPAQEAARDPQRIPEGYPSSPGLYAISGRSNPHVSSNPAISSKCHAAF